MKPILLYILLLNLFPLYAWEYYTEEQNPFMQGESFNLGSNFLDMGDQILNEIDLSPSDDWEEMVIFDENGNVVTANPDNERDYPLQDGVLILLSLTLTYGIVLWRRRQTV